MAWAGGGHRNVQDTLVSNVLIVKSIFIFEYIKDSTFNISHCWIQCVIYFLSLKMKLQVYLSSSKLNRREQELPVWLDCEDSSQPSVLPTRGLVFAMRFSSSKSPAGCEWSYWGKQPGRMPQWNLSNTYTNIQKITFITVAFVKTSFSGRGWGQGEQHLQRETISRGWSLVHQCWDWKGMRFERTMKPLAVKALSEDTAFT